MCIVLLQPKKECYWIEKLLHETDLYKFESQYKKNSKF